MLNLPRSFAAIGVVALCATAGWAAPFVTLDGTIDGSDTYSAFVVDNYVFGAINEDLQDYHASALDIDTVYFAQYGDSRYAGLTVDPVNHTAMFSTSGSPASYTGQTALNIAFYSTLPDPTAYPPALPSYYLNLVFSATGLEQGLLIEYDLANNRKITTDLVLHFTYENNGQNFQFNSDIADMYEIGTGNGLEIRLSDDLFVDRDASNASYFIAQLDDLGGYQDDQIVGHLPEPATMSLLCLGGLVLLGRRRRA